MIICVLMSRNCQSFFSCRWRDTTMDFFGMNSRASVWPVAIHRARDPIHAGTGFRFVQWAAPASHVNGSSRRFQGPSVPARRSNGRTSFLQQLDLLDSWKLPINQTAQDASRQAVTLSIIHPSTVKSDGKRHMRESTGFSYHLKLRHMMLGRYIRHPHQAASSPSGCCRQQLASKIVCLFASQISSRFT